MGIKQRIKTKNNQQERQDNIFKKMSADEKLRTTFGLNRLIFKIARDSSKNKENLLKRMYV